MSSEVSKKYQIHPGWELKRSCPKNMGISGVIVNGTFLLIVFLFVMLQNKESDKVSIQSDVVSVSDIKEAGGNGIPPAEKPVGKSSKGSLAMLLPDDFPSGFMAKIKIIREYSRPTMLISILTPKNVYEPISLNSLFSEVVPDPFEEVSNTFAYGTGENYGQGDDYGLPPQEPYMPNMSFSPLMTRQKGLVMLFPVKFPWYTSHDVIGYVEVIINIDEKGLIEWEIIKEEPKGKGFGIAVEEAIKRSKFNPPLNEYGEPTSIKVGLQCTVCYGCPPSTNSTYGKMDVFQITQN